MAKPLFKWTGGKGRLLQKYTDLNFFPDSSQFDTFVDLFFGGGAVTMWVAEKYPDKKLIINDLNTEMMNLYIQIRDNWEEFREHYLRISGVFIETPQDKRKALYNCYKKRYAWNYKWLSEAEIAANLLVMLKTNFNGIWQGYIMYGGRYSTPPGHINYKPTLFDINKVEQFRDVLCRSTIYNRSFEDVPIPENSWVFADPPYRDTKKMYSDQFDDELQSKLANFLTSNSCLYAESNKETGDGFWQAHYPEEHIKFLDHKYTCGHGGAVNPVTEVLIKNYGNNIPQPTTLDSFFN
ncbi:DNA adenine methylase [Synechococcus phage ACG-2014f]|uniref:site-specific DNA-methyltransferase (adenine-specific) n=2 Tax=Atlauavirus TaxID=2733092 RepID=A0A0E3IC96_9CAUD|nr:DNA adenine methylase [Synechococcus phage ACG-2014f_Syn7803US26]AIX27539.1 DNA adenine methylase [Synechococcus phage ACG-2014f]AIX29032.1 DNA adenine methylase [Synechococcus phage ACG-2014f_Syn7803US26]AIX33454.1 DNA adenine methylase [Synechococcus phage ACG-2014f]AIX34378.1 DNA adenine methylase [Synechococcus phage ACG-2014f]AIX41262.1 DNA adenine methylase [Synechococcus phage ACG-2014f]